MNCVARRIVRLFAVLMLITVLAPDFGWQAAGGMVAHAHDGMAQAHHVPDDDVAHAAHDDCGDCPHHVADDCTSAHDRCCPGHVLGHLAGGQGGMSLPSLAGGTERQPVSVEGFASHLPDGLERPPRSLSA